MTISKQAIKNVEGFDFRNKTFAEFYNFFESLSSFRQQTQVYGNQDKKLNDYLFVNATEKDNKEYPVALMEIYMQEKVTGCWCKKHLMVSPFSCYLLAADGYKNVNDVFQNLTADENLTTAFRKYMIQNYGAGYKLKCLEYITTSSRLESDKLERLYNARMKKIQDKKIREIALLGTENIEELIK